MLTVAYKRTKSKSKKQLEADAMKEMIRQKFREIYARSEARKAVLNSTAEDVSTVCEEIKKKIAELSSIKKGKARLIKCALSQAERKRHVRELARINKNIERFKVLIAGL